MVRKGFQQKLGAGVLSLVLIGQASWVGVAASSQLGGKLITSGNLPVMVNGNSALGGATIVSGTVLETPANVTATVQIEGLGLVELLPDSIAVIEFSANNIKVTLRRGCATLETNKGTKGAIVDSQNRVFSTTTDAEEGVTGDTDFRRLGAVQAQSNGDKRRRFPTCGIVPAGGTLAEATLPSVLGAAAGPAIAAGGGLSGTAIAAIIAAAGGAAIIGGIIGAGDDPSPSSPR